MINKAIIILTTTIGLINICQAQDKKDIKKYKIKTVTQTITDVSSDKEKTHKDLFQKYDGNGNTLEEVEFKSDGSIKQKTINTFDNNNNLIQEDKYEDGKFTERKIYTYNPEGEKTAELIYDSANKLLRKSIYVYNNKGMKIEKKTFDENGKFISLKKYTYEN